MVFTQAMQGTKVLCRERNIDPSLICSQCVKVFTGIRRRGSALLSTTFNYNSLSTNLIHS